VTVEALVPTGSSLGTFSPVRVPSALEAWDLAPAPMPVQGREVMKVAEVINAARDSITVKRVYGEPYEKDGLTIIPAAAVGGGAGGGTGHDDKGSEGEGGGFGASARPAGAYVIKDGHVAWRPALDLNRIIQTVGTVLVVYLLTRSRMVRARARAERRSA
jgi:uncharacterized spore protein YtfJ